MLGEAFLASDGFMEMRVDNIDEWLEELARSNPGLTKIRNKMEEGLAGFVLEKGRGKPTPGGECRGPTVSFVIGRAMGGELLLSLCYRCGWTLWIRIPMGPP